MDTKNNKFIKQPTRQARAKARSCPNGWVYVIEGSFRYNDAVPPEAIVGVWKVNAAGEIIGDFIPNPNYRPKPQ